MAYAERVPNKKTLAVVAEAWIYGIASYGLATGLGIEHASRAVTVPNDIPKRP